MCSLNRVKDFRRIVNRAEMAKLTLTLAAHALSEEGCSFLQISRPPGRGRLTELATGQAAVKFKQLADDERSDLLGGNWEFDQLGTIPEPASILCWSVMGGCGLLFSRKRKKKAA